MPVFNPQINPIQNQNPTIPSFTIPNPVKGIGVYNFVPNYWNKPKDKTNYQQDKKVTKFQVDPNKVADDFSLGEQTSFNDNDPLNRLPKSSFWNSSGFNANTISPLTFRTTTGREGDDYNVNPTYNIEDLTLDQCIIEVSQQKRVIKTNIINKNGSIKEYIGLDDYQITITGTLWSGVNGLYPFEKVKMLYKWLDNNTYPIYVENNYLNDVFNIDFLLIQDYDIFQEEGSVSQQKFRITAISDTYYQPSKDQNPYYRK